MKNKIMQMLALMASAMAFTSCTEDTIVGDRTEATPIYTFTASMEGRGASRATIDGFDVKWKDGDAIIVTDRTNYSKYNLTDGGGTVYGQFTIDDAATPVSGNDIYAFYPYHQIEYKQITYDEALAAVGGYDFILEDLQNNWDSLDEEEVKEFMEMMYHISPENQEIVIDYFRKTRWIVGPDVDVVLPKEQTVAPGENVDPKALFMVAKANDVNELDFKNVFAYIKVTTTKAYKKIKVCSHNVESLAGTFNVSVTSTPTVSDVKDGSSVVTFKSASGSDLEAGTYYIAVLPGTIGRGFEVRLYTGEDTFEYSTVYSSLSLARNNVYNGIGTLKLGADWTLLTKKEDWWPGNNSHTKLIIETGVSGTMPAGARAMNNDNTVWSVVKDANTVAIQTSASKIFATNLEHSFAYFIDDDISISNLDNVEVSQVIDFYGCLSYSHKITEIDLSSWMFRDNANTDYLLHSAWLLEKLWLNNTFVTGTGPFFDVRGTVWAENPPAGSLTIYGVTDPELKEKIKNSYGWVGSVMKFDGE